MLATLISLVLVALVDAEEAAPTPIENGLNQAQELIAKRKWKQAKQELLALVQAHPESTELVAQWPRVAEELALCTFWDDYKVPKAQDVVPGIVSWKESRGALKLRYRAGERSLAAGDTESGDFINISGEDESNPIYLHPVRFIGPYTIEVSGRKLKKPPIIFVEWVWNSLRGLGYGKSYVVGFQDTTSILAYERGRLRGLDSSTSMMLYGRPYSFEVRVASNAISGSYKNKRQVKVSREKGDYGQFGLSDLTSFDQVEISGEVDSAWIAGLVQGRVQGDWTKFKEKYDPLDEIPADLRQRVKGIAQTEREFGFAYPGPVEERNDSVMEKARQYYEDKEWTEGLKYINELPADKVTTTNT